MRRKAIAALRKRRNRMRVFAMLFLAIGGAGYALYPEISPVQAIGGIYDVAVTTPSPVNRVSIEVTPDFSQNRITLQANIWWVKEHWDGEVQVILPESAWRGHVACPERATCSRLDTGQPVLNMEFPARWVPTGLNREVAFGTSAEWQIPNVGLGIARNREYISIIRPAITIYDRGGTAVHADTTAVIQYWLNLPGAAIYAWDGGDTTAAPFTSSDSVSWVYPAGQLPTDPFDANAPPILDSGTNIGVQSEAERNLFFSGILLGIAGGVLIAAIQDLIAVGMELRLSEDATRQEKARLDYSSVSNTQQSVKQPHSQP